MRKSIILGLILGLGTNAIAAKDFFHEKLRVANYYREMVSKDLEMVAPKGTYSVEVSVNLDEGKLKAYLSQKSEEVALPLAGIMGGESAQIKFSEVEASTSFDELLSFTKNKNVRVGFTQAVDPEFRNWIRERLIKQVGLKLDAGDSIETYDLPKEFASSWVQWLQMGKPKWESSDWTPLWMLLGGLAVLLIGAGFLVSFGVKALGAKLSGEVARMSEAISDSMQGGGRSMAQDFAQEEKHKVHARESQEVLQDSKIFEKLELDVVRMFCVDAISNPEYKHVPYALIYHFLSNEKSELLDKALNEDQKPFPSAEDVVPTRAQIGQLLASGFQEYKQKSKQPFVQALNSFAVSHLVSFAKQLEAPESVVLLNHLLPLKKKAVSSAIPVQVRLNWVKEFESLSISGSKMTSIQEGIMNKLKNFDSGAAHEEHKQNDSHSTVQLLEVATFAEDEQLYLSTQDSPGLYRGILLVLHHWSTEAWNSVDARELALITFGYSEQTHQFVTSKLSGKRAEWYKSFVENYSKTGMDFLSPTVKKVRELYVSRNETKISVHEAGTKTAA